MAGRGGSASGRGANGALPTIWSLTIDPVDPDILFAGTRPAGVYRSRDGGRHWEKLAVDLARECSIGTPFVTSVVVDPDDHRMVWAGVEIDGVFRSTDGGDTWTHLEEGLYDPDIHAVTIAATQPKRLYASTAREMFVSDNLGETWEPLGIKEKWPLPYARGMAVKADDPGVLFAGCGETTTGEKGHVLRTTDFGESWEILPLPTEPNATVWGLATHPADPDRIVAFSLFGEVYVTEDAGASWRKIAREFGEIRSRSLGAKLARFLPGSVQSSCIRSHGLDPLAARHCRRWRPAWALWTETCRDSQTRTAQRSYLDDDHRFPGSRV